MANKPKIDKETGEILAEEAKVNETEQDAEGAEKLFIVREPFTSKGKQCYAYKLKAKLRGRDKVVNFVPPRSDKDKAGYGVIDIVFDQSETAELIVKAEVYEQNGVKKKRDVYFVRNAEFFPDGRKKVWECPIVPERDSDKSLLLMLFANGED